jgi:threonine dehydrogenase-like Zn-dependent dehydrogenase
VPKRLALLEPGLDVDGAKSPAPGPRPRVGGVIEEVGPDVLNLKVGGRVTIPFHEADGTCPYCRAGHQNLCDHEIIRI